MKHHAWPLFSSPLFSIETGLKKNELKKLETKLKKEKTIHSPINKISENPKQNSFHTGVEGVLQKEEYETLKDVVIKSIRFINDTYFKYKTNFIISKSWVAWASSKSSCTTHRHHNCFLSGVVYIKAKEECGDIEFENFNHRDISVEPRHKDTLYNVERFWVTPTPGLLLLFPSNMYHKVHENNSNEDRISVSFDVMPTSFLNKYIKNNEA